MQNQNTHNTENQSDINNSSNTENQSDIDNSSNIENQNDINSSSNTDQLGNTNNLNRNNSFTYTFILEHIASFVTFFTGAIMCYNLLVAESKSIFFNLPYDYFIDINQVRTFRVILVILCIFLFIYENFIYNIDSKPSELFFCLILILLLCFLPIYFIFSIFFYALVLILLIIMLLKYKKRYGKLNYKQVLKILPLFILFTILTILFSKNKILFFDNKKYEVIQGIKNWQVIITELGDGKILVMTGVESEDESDTEKRFLTINTKEGYKIIERNDEQVIKHVTYDKVNVSEGVAVNDCSDTEIDKIRDLMSIMEEETPEIKYMDMEEALLEFYTKPIKDDYKFFGRFSNNCYAYILGISKTDTPPLRDLDSSIGKTGYIQLKKKVYDQIGNDDSSEDIYDFPGILSFYQSNDGKYIYLGVKQYSDFEDISGDTKYSGINLGEVFNEIVNKN